ncbi:hypothetical protein ACSS6W_004223 [Trichoderma asperelloides]
MSSTIYSKLEETLEDRRELNDIPGICRTFQHPSVDAQQRISQDFSQQIAKEHGLPEYLIEIAGLHKFKAPTLRLLILEPGLGEEIVRCHLQQHDLRRKPKFEALSYVWGDPANPTNIICCGEIMPVGRNLDAALRKLRSPVNQRVLWVDALCINQKDPVEQASQVEMMDYIYSRAEQVLVWLGEEREDDSLAFEAIEKTVVFMNALWHDGNMNESIKKIINNPALPPNAWQHIGALFLRSYFKRLWVIQEVVNSSSAQVFCGNKTIPWDSMCMVTNLLTAGFLAACSPEVRRSVHIPTENESNIHLIETLRHTKAASQPGRPFFDILFHAQSFQSSLPRDKLFAILNLPWVEEYWIPLPNYRCSDLEVFRNFVVVDLMHNKSVKALSWVNTAGVDRESDGPSWVPTVADFEGPKPSFFMGRGRPTSSFLLQEAEAYLDDSESSLIINCLLLHSAIKNIADSRSACYEKAGLDLPLQSADITEASIEVERNWLRSCFRVLMVSKWPHLFQGTKTELDFGEIFSSDHYTAFLLVMSCNWNPYSNEPIIPWVSSSSETETNTVREQSNELDHLAFMRDITGRLIMGHPISNNNWEDYLCIISQEHAKWKVFCGLGDGRIGWAPRNVSVGDRVCIFKGGRETFLLRNARDKDGNTGMGWKLHGECYFERLENGKGGLLEGEGIEDVYLSIV